jgi:hypothetical protein
MNARPWRAQAGWPFFLRPLARWAVRARLYNMNQNIARTEDATTEIIGFGQLDGKGRELGLSVRKSAVAVCLGPLVHLAWARGRLECPDLYTTATHAYSPQGRGYDLAPGLYYYADCQATRAGESYGASQGGRIFATEAERDAFMAKRLAESRKRAPKAATSGRSGRKTA